MDSNNTNPVVSDDQNDATPVVPQDDNNVEVNPVSAPLDAGTGPGGMPGFDEDDATLTPDAPTDNPLDTETGIPEEDMNPADTLGNSDVGQVNETVDPQDVKGEKEEDQIPE